MCDVLILKALLVVITTPCRWQHCCGLSLLPQGPAVSSGAALQADMYSFGVVLWELVTHDTPIRGRLYDPQVRSTCLRAAAHWGLSPSSFPLLSCWTSLTGWASRSR